MPQTQICVFISDGFSILQENWNAPGLASWPLPIPLVAAHEGAIPYSATRSPGLLPPNGPKGGSKGDRGIGSEGDGGHRDRVLKATQIEGRAPCKHPREGELKRSSRRVRVITSQPPKARNASQIATVLWAQT